MKKSIVLLFIIISSVSFGQSLNDYKYALVPSKFSFLKEPNQYRLNNLSKLFMEKYGFETYLDIDSQPSDFESHNCNKVFVDVIDNSGTFTTKISVLIKDCKGTVLYTSKEGTSRDKDYAVAYNEALRQAFGSMNGLNHKYVEKKAIENGQEPKVETIIKENLESVTSTNLDSSVLFAQPIANGFQLINNEPKVIMKIFKTSNKDCFLATKRTVQGVLISKDKDWFFEYYENDKLVSEKVEVKL